MGSLSLSVVYGLLVLWTFQNLLVCKDLRINCNFDIQNSTCPNGYCCVRDDFLFTETYCKQLGVEGSSCATMISSFECKCQEGFFCSTNIHAVHSSVFGKCRSLSGYATETTPDSWTTDDTNTEMTPKDAA